MGDNLKDSSKCKRKILVVDDERDTLDLTEAILQQSGFDVLLAASAREAFEQLSKKPDAVLLDVMMPDTSGLTVLSILRDTPRTAQLPVILLTALQRDNDLIDGYRSGADYYITKPCTATQILFGLNLVLGGSRAQPSASEP